MNQINAKEIMINFCNHHDIVPTKDESILLQLAIMEGSIAQIKIEMDKLIGED